jgi:hypothetical protein
MSQTYNKFLPTGIAILLIFAITVGSLYIQETKNVSIENKKSIQQINKTLNDYVDKWDGRIKVSNEVNNSTQRQLLTLAQNLTDVVHRLEVAEVQRGNVTNNILGNLTSHRLVTNHTNDIAEQLANQTLVNQELILELERQALDLQNKTNHIINTTGALTGPEYEKLADQRVKSIVNQTVANLTKDHELILDEIDNIKKNQPPGQIRNEPQGPKVK